MSRLKVEAAAWLQYLAYISTIRVAAGYYTGHPGRLYQHRVPSYPKPILVFQYLPLQVFAALSLACWWSGGPALTSTARDSASKWWGGVCRMFLNGLECYWQFNVYGHEKDPVWFTRPHNLITITNSSLLCWELCHYLLCIPWVTAPASFTRSKLPVNNNWSHVYAVCPNIT